MKLKCWCENLKLGAILGFVVGIFSTNAFADVSGYTLNVELSPAVCKIDASQKRLRQCLEGYSLSVAGLYPVTSSKGCETSKALSLTPVQKRVIMRIMPDENVQARLWRNVGGCIAMNANQYFRLMVNYAERLKIAEEFSSPTSVRVTREWLEKKFVQQNAGMSTQSFNFYCGALDRKTTVLTNIEVCYHTSGRYTACKQKAVESCPDQFMIQGSY